MCLLVGRGTVVGALLWTSNFLHGRHCTALCIVLNTKFFAISATNVDDIDTYSPGAVVNSQRSNGNIVSAKILGPSECGADYQSITYERMSVWGLANVFAHGKLYFTRDVLSQTMCLKCRTISNNCRWFQTEQTKIHPRCS